MFILNKLHPIRLSYKVIKLAVKFQRLIFRSKTNYKQHMMSKIVFYLFAVYCKTMAMNHLHFSYVSIDIFTNQSIGQKPTTRWGHSNLMKLPWYRLYNCLQKLISFVCFQSQSSQAKLKCHLCCQGEINVLIFCGYVSSIVLLKPNYVISCQWLLRRLEQ